MKTWIVRQLGKKWVVILLVILAVYAVMKLTGTAAGVYLGDIRLSIVG